MEIAGDGIDIDPAPARRRHQTTAHTNDVDAAAGRSGDRVAAHAAHLDRSAARRPLDRAIDLFGSQTAAGRVHGKAAAEPRGVDRASGRSDVGRRLRRYVNDDLRGVAKPFAAPEALQPAAPPLDADRDAGWAFVKAQVEELVEVVAARGHRDCGAGRRVAGQRDAANVCVQGERSTRLERQATFHLEVCPGGCREEHKSGCQCEKHLRARHRSLLRTPVA